MIVDDLVYSYEGVFDLDEITDVVGDARRVLESGATITQFLPVLVAKQAREQLMTKAQVESPRV